MKLHPMVCILGEVELANDGTIFCFGCVVGIFEKVLNRPMIVPFSAFC